jgi:hypothetical protein
MRQKRANNIRWPIDGSKSVICTFFKLQRQIAEGTAIYWTRTMLGDKRTKELANKTLSTKQQSKLAQRHTNQTVGIIRGWQSDE